MCGFFLQCNTIASKSIQHLFMLNDCSKKSTIMCNRRWPSGIIKRVGVSVFLCGAWDGHQDRIDN